MEIISSDYLHGWQNRVWQGDQVTNIVYRIKDKKLWAAVMDQVLNNMVLL